MRNRRRSGLTVVAIAIAVAFVWLTTALTQGMMTRAVARATDGLMGQVQIHHRDWKGEPRPELVVPSGTVATLEALDPALAVAPRSYGQGFAIHRGRSVGVMLIGVDPRREQVASHLDGRVTAGRYLPTASATDGPASALLGARLAEQLGATPGATIEVLVYAQAAADGQAPVPVSLAVLGVVSTGMVELDDAAVFVPVDVVASATKTSEPHEIMVRGQDPAAADALARRLASVPALSALSVQSWRQRAPDLAMWMDFAADVFVAFAIVIVISVASAIVLTQSMVTFERRRELAVLRAIGLRPSQLLRLLAWESVVLGGLGAVLGVVLGTPLIAVLASTGIDLSGGEALQMSGLVLESMVYPPLSAVVPLQATATVVVLAGIASVLAGLPTARTSPLAVLRES